MAPILGIYASQISGHLFAPSGAYDSIATTTVGGGGTSSITFSSIPSTYTHLQVRAIVQDNTGTYGDSNPFIRFNSDSGNNYSAHSLLGDGSSAFTRAYSTTSQIRMDYFSSTTVATNQFAGLIIDVLDYGNANKYKTIRALGGCDHNGTIAGYGGAVGISSGLWQSTSAITTLTIYPANTLFTQYSSFALYGIKGN